MDNEIPFKDLLEREHPEVYEYIKNAVRMLHRQQNLLAKIKNNGSVDYKVRWFCYIGDLHWYRLEIVGFNYL